MGAEKTEIKKAAYVDIGLQMEKLRDAAEVQVAEHRGATRALQDLTKKISVAATVDIAEKDLERYMQKLRDREAELAKIEEREPGAVSMGPIDIIKFGLEFAIRAARQAESACQSERNKGLIAEGSLLNAEAAVQAIKKQVDIAQAQIDRALQTNKDGDPEHDLTSPIERPMGVRPAGIKAKRLAEEATVVPEPVAQDEPAPVPVKETAPDLPDKPAVREVTVPKAVSPTSIPMVSVADVQPVAKQSNKKAVKKRKGRLESKFSGNGVRK